MSGFVFNPLIVASHKLHRRDKVQCIGEFLEGEEGISIKASSAVENMFT